MKSKLTTNQDRIVAVVATFAVFFLAILSRSGMMSLPPIYDELYHLLPAMSWQDERMLSILDGSYDRGAILTYLVAFSFDLAEARQISAARFIPSILPGAFLVALVFIWVRLVAGWAAAAVTLAFLIFWPNGIEVSQYVRFYSLQGAAFITFSIATYLALTNGRTVVQNAVLIAAAAFSLLLAIQLQLSTLIAAAGVFAWLFFAYGIGWLYRHIWLRWLALAGVLSVIAVLLSGVANDTLQRLWEIYRWEPWPPLRDVTFYHRDFRSNYPTFWPLFPFAAIIALRARSMPASFCLAVFVTAFVVHSFGGLKNIRYLYPTMPFFFAIWAIAISSIFKLLLTYFCEKVLEIATEIWRTRIASMLATLIVLASCVFLVFGNPAFVTSIRMMAGTQTEFLLGKRRLEWVGIRGLVWPLIEKNAIIITTEELTTVQWLGDYDVAFNRPRFSEMQFLLGPETEPFVSDIRTGRPIVGLLENIHPLLICEPVGMILSNARWIDTSQARQIAEIVTDAGANVSKMVRADASVLAWENSVAPATVCPDYTSPRSGTTAADRLRSGERQPRMLWSASDER